MEDRSSGYGAETHIVSETRRGKQKSPDFAKVVLVPSEFALI
jgi:hypothetical protein